MTNSFSSLENVTDLPLSYRRAPSLFTLTSLAFSCFLVCWDCLEAKKTPARLVRFIQRKLLNNSAYLYSFINISTPTLYLNHYPLLPPPPKEKPSYNNKLCSASCGWSCVCDQCQPLLKVLELLLPHPAGRGSGEYDPLVCSSLQLGNSFLLSLSSKSFNIDPVFYRN